MNEIPNAVSGNAQIKLRTISNGATLGEEMRQITLTCPETIVPDAGVLRVQPVNLYNDTYLQTISSAVLTLSGEKGVYGSQIVTIMISGNGRASSSRTLELLELSQAGTVTCVATVTDSRGRMASTTMEIIVEPYAVPVVASLIVERCNADNVYSPAGTGGHVHVSCGYAAVAGNRISMTVQYKATKDTEWSQEDTIVMDDSGYFMFATPDTDGQLLSNNSYEVRIRIVDDVGTETILLNLIGTAYVYCAWEPKSKAFGFGCYPEGKRRLQVSADWSVFLGQEVLYDYVHPVGTIVLTEGSEFTFAQTNSSWSAVGTIDIGGTIVTAWKRNE